MTQRCSRPRPHARAASIAIQTFCPLTGMSMWRTPRCDTASMTALCTAGVEPMVPDSPMPFGAERVQRRRRLRVGRLEARELGRARDRVVHEVGGLRVAVLVVGDAFPQRLGRTLRDPAVLLARHEQRIEDASRSRRRRHGGRLDLARLDVDLDDGDMRAERIGRLALVEVEFVRRARAPCPRGASPVLRRNASSAHDSAARARRPRRGARLRSSTMSSTLASSRCAASWRPLRQHLFARLVERAAADLQRAGTHRSRDPRGTRPVSDWTTVTLSIGMPSSSCTIIANAVSWPWPCADVPTVAVTLPSSLTSMAPYSWNSPPAVTST